MRLSLIATAFATFCLALPTTAQKVQVFGGNSERNATTQILFGENLAGGISIEHGQPMWQDSHDEMLPKLKGKLLRLGKDWWTTMTTSFALNIGGTKVPAGSYLVGLNCDQDGEFALALLEATKGLKAGALPFSMNEAGSMNWKPDYLCPLDMKKGTADEVVEKMTMTLKIDGATLAGSYTLAWGTHQLVSVVTVSTGKGSDKGHDGEDGGEHGGKHGKQGEHGSGRGK